MFKPSRRAFGIATLFTLAGIVIVAVRLGRRAIGVSWSAGGARHIAIAVGFLILAVSGAIRRLPWAKPETAGALIPAPQRPTA